MGKIFKLSFVISLLYLNLLGWFSFPAQAQVSGYELPVTSFTSTGTTSWYPVYTTAAQYHQFATNPLSGTGTCTVSEEYSTDGSTVAGTIFSNINCATATNQTSTSLTVNYVRIHVTVFTYTAAVYFNALGCNVTSCGGSSGGGGGSVNSVSASPPLNSTGGTNPLITAVTSGNGIVGTKVGTTNVTGPVTSGNIVTWDIFGNLLNSGINISQVGGGGSNSLQQNAIDIGNSSNLAAASGPNKQTVLTCIFSSDCGETINQALINGEAYNGPDIDLTYLSVNSSSNFLIKTNPFVGYNNSSGGGYLRLPAGTIATNVPWIIPNGLPIMGIQAGETVISATTTSSQGSSSFQSQYPMITSTDGTSATGTVCLNGGSDPRIYFGTMSAGSCQGNTASGQVWPAASKAEYYGIYICPESSSVPCTSQNSLLINYFCGTLEYQGNGSCQTGYNPNSPNNCATGITCASDMLSYLRSPYSAGGVFNYAFVVPVVRVGVQNGGYTDGSKNPSSAIGDHEFLRNLTVICNDAQTNWHDAYTNMWGQEKTGYDQFDGRDCGWNQEIIATSGAQDSGPYLNMYTLAGANASSTMLNVQNVGHLDGPVAGGTLQAGALCSNATQGFAIYRAAGGLTAGTDVQMGNFHFQNAGETGGNTCGYGIQAGDNESWPWNETGNGLNVFNLDGCSSTCSPQYMVWISSGTSYFKGVDVSKWAATNAYYDNNNSTPGQDPSSGNYSIGNESINGNLNLNGNNFSTTGSVTGGTVAATSTLNYGGSAAGMVVNGYFGAVGNSSSSSTAIPQYSSVSAVETGAITAAFNGPYYMLGTCASTCTVTVPSSSAAASGVFTVANVSASSTWSIKATSGNPVSCYGAAASGSATCTVSAGQVAQAVVNINNGNVYVFIIGTTTTSNSTTVNSQTCTLGSTCTIPIQTNSSGNTSQAGINLETSSTNAVGLTVTPTNTATNVEKFEITGAYTTDSIWLMSENTAASAVTGDYLPPSGVINSIGLAQGLCEQIMPRAGTIDRLYVKMSAAEGASSTLQFTLQDNNSNQTVTCTVGNSASSCNDTSHSFTFAAADLIDIYLTQTGLATSATYQIAVGYH